jgi:hypothetical protein
MLSCFAIIPDGEELPCALFTELEDAMDWACRAYAGKTYRIRFVRMAQIEKADLGAADLRA